MNGLLHHIQQAVAAGNVELSIHAYERMVELNIDPEEVLAGIDKAILLEDYTTSRGEPRIRVEQRETDGGRIFVVWEAPEEMRPNVLLVTAHRPK